MIRGTGWLGHGEQGFARDPPGAAENGGRHHHHRVRWAQVALGSEIRQGAVTMTRKNADGKAENLGEVVTGIVLKRMGANTKTTIDAVDARIERINQALPEGVRFEAFYDQADLIKKAGNTVAKALIEAFIFIVIVLVLFLLNVRAVLLVLISIPLSVGMALALMAYNGLSANLMSLSGPGGLPLA